MSKHNKEKMEKTSSFISSSLVYKLNTWHLGRMFWAFIGMDILVLLIFGVLFAYQTQQNVVKIANNVYMNFSEDNMAETSILTTEEMQRYQAGGYVVAIEDAWPEETSAILNNGIARLFWNDREVVGTFGRIFPDGSTEDRTEAAFISVGEGNRNFFDRFNGVYFKAWIVAPDGAGYLTIRRDIGDPMKQLLVILCVLLILQILNILTHAGSDARAIRRRLRPIAELTKTARSLNAAGFSPHGQGMASRRSEEELRNLAGAISSIDADQLDTRITVDAAQNELKDLAAAINDMLDRIDQAYQAQIRFVSDASHELRTPIAVIQGYVNLLDRWGKDDPKALGESIEAIKSEADNMKNLIEQLLFLARGDMDTMALHMETIDISELAEEVFRETTMIDPNHAFSSKLGENVLAYGDEQLIKQAVRIFIDNSIKYTPSGESISISTRNEEEHAVIVIQDNGIGIPPDDVRFVFDRFFRADESRARKTGGTGLGLSIAKWIIDRHNGDVSVLSRQEMGTRITVTLPNAKVKINTGQNIEQETEQEAEQQKM